MDINFYQVILSLKYNKLINYKKQDLHKIILIKNEIVNFKLSLNFNSDYYFDVLKITKKIFTSLTQEEFKIKIKEYIKKKFNFIEVLQFESRECKIRTIASSNYDSRKSDFDNWIIAEKNYDYPNDYSPLNLFIFLKKYLKYHFYLNKIYNSLVIGKYIYLFDTNNNNILKIENDLINFNTNYPIQNDYLIGLNINQIKKILLNLKYLKILIDTWSDSYIIKTLFTQFICLKNKLNNPVKNIKNNEIIFRNKIKNIQLITKNNKVLEKYIKYDKFYYLTVIIPITINRSLLQYQNIHKNNIKVFIIVNNKKEYLGILNNFNNNNNTYSVEFKTDNSTLIKSNYPSGSIICFS